MKCLVCGKKFEAAECPRCHFPYLQIPYSQSAEDREKILEKLSPIINVCRMDFLRSIQVQLLAYRWKDQNGKVVLDHEEWMELGCGDELLNEKWIGEKFARIPDQDTIPVTVRITVGDDTCDRSVQVPNLHEPELQQLGACIGQDCSLRLLLRNDSETPTQSEPISLTALFA